jgi:hypothetical protein
LIKTGIKIRTKIKIGTETKIWIRTATGIRHKIGVVSAVAHRLEAGDLEADQALEEELAAGEVAEVAAGEGAEVVANTPHNRHRLLHGRYRCIR